MQNTWFDHKAGEQQAPTDKHDSIGFYDAVKAAYGPTQTALTLLTNTDGESLIAHPTAINQQWEEHFSKLLNRVSMVSDELLNNVHKLSTFTNAPTHAEVLKAVQVMKNIVSPGPHAIPAKVFQNMEEIFSLTGFLNFSYGWLQEIVS